MADVATASKADRIRMLNDTFRQTFLGGKVMMTQGVAALPEATKMALFTAIRTFSDFTEGNDPHQEHDFVSVEIGGEKYFAKIDYFDRSLQYGSEDPSDPDKTTRVLTIMHASEY